MTLAALVLVAATLPASEPPVVFRSRLCGVDFTYPSGWKVKQMEDCFFEVTARARDTADPRCPQVDWVEIRLFSRGVKEVLAGSRWPMEGAGEIKGGTWRGRTTSISTRCYPRDFPECVDFASVQCDVQVAVIGTASRSAEVSAGGGDMQEADFTAALQGIAFSAPKR